MGLLNLIAGLLQLRLNGLIGTGGLLGSGLDFLRLNPRELKLFLRCLRLLLGFLGLIPCLLKLLLRRQGFGLGGLQLELRLLQLRLQGRIRVRDFALGLRCLSLAARLLQLRLRRLRLALRFLRLVPGRLIRRK